VNCKTQVVLAAGIGYVLGRQHKLRWGLLLGAAAASGQLGRTGGLLQHGVRALGSLPEIGKLSELGAPLVEATKDAARAAVTGRIDSVSGRLRERADALREPRTARKQEEPPEDREPVEEEEREQPPRRPRAAASEPEWDDEEESASPEGRGEDRSARQGARRSPRPVEDYEREDDEDEEVEEVEDEKEPVAARARPGGRPPVRRREG
jgi:hypothetical protein